MPTSAAVGCIEARKVLDLSPISAVGAYPDCAIGAMYATSGMAMPVLRFNLTPLAARTSRTVPVLRPAEDRAATASVGGDPHACGKSALGDNGTMRLNMDGASLAAVAPTHAHFGSQFSAVGAATTAGVQHHAVAGEPVGLYMQGDPVLADLNMAALPSSRHVWIIAVGAFAGVSSFGMEDDAGRSQSCGWVVYAAPELRFYATAVAARTPDSVGPQVTVTPISATPAVHVYL